MGRRGAEIEDDSMLLRTIFHAIDLKTWFPQKIEDAPSTRWGRMKARLTGVVDVRIRLPLFKSLFMIMANPGFRRTSLA